MRRLPFLLVRPRPLFSLSEELSIVEYILREPLQQQQKERNILHILNISQWYQ